MHGHGVAWPIIKRSEYSGYHSGRFIKKMLFFACAEGCDSASTLGDHVSTDLEGNDPSAWSEVVFLPLDYVDFDFGKRSGNGKNFNKRKVKKHSLPVLRMKFMDAENNEPVEVAEHDLPRGRRSRRMIHRDWRDQHTFDYPYLRWADADQAQLEERVWNHVNPFI